MSLAVLAGLGAAWWIAVGFSDEVRDLTLGSWSAQWLAAPDLCCFVAVSVVAAIGGSWRWAAVAAVWTTTVTIALLAYALSTANAGWGVVAMIPSAVLMVAAAVTLRAGNFP
ncbi:MAG: isoprenylcysteine carboxylmethyltransferase family protein, partial [Actinobacteria bacterium]|nr:isoprenylcysteine carboxylmethyltransferase family protein [Actinomycetota bacterium]